MSFPKKALSSAMKRTSDWIFSQDIPSDVTIRAGGVSFSLHKFPLVSRSGYIRKSLSDMRDDELSSIEIPDVPGGAEAFELAAKFCYDIKFEISTENIAKLRCVAEFLEMTEEYSVGNLVARTEVFLKEVALQTLSGAVSVLHQSESLFPVAEKAKLISRSIDAIAFIAFKESQLCVSGKVDWWAEDLTVLRIDLFQRVLVAMMARGFKQFALGPILMLYAQKSLRGLDIIGKGRKKIEPHEEHETRVVLETIVSLLPKEKNAMSVSFLSMLLRAAIYLETTVACRLDLEQRMSLQLNQAVLDDLLIPSYSFTGDTLFDVDTVQRIMTNYLENEIKGNVVNFDRDEEYTSPLLSDLERVVKLMETFLAEIASDRNLPVTKFIRIAELIPEQARVTEDGMYRAIDIYLKAHPSLTDMERKKICSLMDCQKLSREACAHAAQNERLPVQTVVQVLYYEQQRLRHAMDGSHTSVESRAPVSIESAYSKDLHPIPDELSRLRKENKELKTEVLKLKLKLKEIESSVVKSGMSSPMGKGIPTSEKPPLPRKSFISSVSKKLSALTSSTPKARTRPNKDWRHSIS